MTENREESELIAQARRGSHSAFEKAVKPYVDELRRHCYRMSASLDDADDLVQETLFRAWRGLGTFSGRSSFRTWLYRIATNRSLDVLGGKAWRDPHSDSVADPAWLQPYPTDGWNYHDTPQGSVSQLEAIGLAFLVTIQKLPPKQRAALILRDVLGYSAIECAEILESTTASVNSALQRARASLPQPSEDGQAQDPNVAQERLVAEFVSAWRSDDVSGLVDLLADDAALTMPPQPLTLRGPAEIVEFLRTTLGDLSSTRISRLEANGQPSFAVHAPNAEGLLMFSGVIVLTLQNSSITRMVGFGDTSVAEAFDVPLRQTP